MTPLSDKDRAYDVWVTSTDMCQECGERYWMGDPCACTEEIEEDEDDETLETDG